MELPVSPASPRPDVHVEVRSITTNESPVPALRLWGIRRSITLAVAAALTVVVALIVAASWYAGWPGIRRDATVTTATLFDLLKLVFAVVAGVGGVAALVVAYRRQRVAEHTNELAEFAHQLAFAADLRAEVAKALAEAADERAKVETERNGVRLFNERFAKASEQIGSDKAAIRLAGVYATAGLADDWREGRQTCIDVLCAYLRMPYTSPETPSGASARQADGQAPIVDAETNRAAHEEREVRHTVIRLIGRHLRLVDEDLTSWRGLDFDFTGAVFDGGDFSDATFSGGRVSFDEASFNGGKVNFRRTSFSGGRVSFAGASFSAGYVAFDGASFSGGLVNFRRASFTGGDVSFSEASFSGGDVSFGGASFSGGGGNFGGASFSGGDVSFGGASFSGGRVNFGGASFSGGRVNFVGASFSAGWVSFGVASFTAGWVNFGVASFDGGRVYFDGASFSGGQVRLDKALIEVPPEFDAWPGGSPPEGLLLPPKARAWADGGHWDASAAVDAEKQQVNAADSAKISDAL
ncbi:pentapeptide repeat-containing protein [Micromonospora sp. LAH09]|uniref:pentapeptide repeat-containing protein n=1 Tax=Micromonospora cabrerizensis TaxID=2911213 RepID=UPI001EE9AC4C|nr:pentapeptide repeat-containing protein [Micromonospora cabrerizensis]MCG5469689.1 pentapeptide repeat-containing protein [Micromonospora cabrerizensis]